MILTKKCMNYSFIIIVYYGKIKTDDIMKEDNRIEEKNNKRVIGGNVFRRRG